MAKFVEKKEVRKPTVINEMGEKAYRLEAKEELLSTVLTTFLNEDSYYESGKEITERIVKCANEVPIEFLCKLAIYTRTEGNIRSCSHLLAALAAQRLSGTEFGSRFYEKMIVRPDDMPEILGAYAWHKDMKQDDLKKIPNAMKKGFKNALESLDPYQIDKYKMNGHKIKLIDLVRLCHPKTTDKNAEAYKRLVKGEKLSDLYESKVLEKEMTKAGQDTVGLSEEEKLAAKREAFVSVLSNVKGMPIMNLLRNLKNILIYAPDMVDEACRQLTIEEKVENSRLLPFRFASAYSEVEKCHLTFDGNSDTIQFESDIKKEKEFEVKKQQILDALEQSIEISCRNIPKLQGNVAVLCDCSGSVYGDSGGSSKVSAFSKTTRAAIGVLFGCMLAKSQDDVYFGLFGDKLLSAPIHRDKGLLAYNKEVFQLGDLCGKSTETGIYDFMREAVEQNKKIDNVVVFSDCQIGSERTKRYAWDDDFTPWYGVSEEDKGESFHKMFKKFKKNNPDCKWVVVDITQVKGNSVFDKSQGIVNIAGWSQKIFDYIATLSKGYDAMIKEIEAIEI